MLWLNYRSCHSNAVSWEVVTLWAESEKVRRKKKVNILLFSKRLKSVFKCFVLSSVCCFLALYRSTFCLTVFGRITMSFTTSHNEHRQARMQTRAHIVLKSLGICMFSVRTESTIPALLEWAKKLAYDVMLRCFFKIWLEKRFMVRKWRQWHCFARAA